MNNYFCCGLHHSSYCPECRGKICKERIEYRLNPKGGNENKIKQINEMRANNERNTFQR